MKISLVVAAAENGVIGRQNTLPWHLPRDLARFKALTLDHTIVMGRKTFESIGKPLPRRRNVVISRNRDYAPVGAEVVACLDQALAITAGEDEVFVIGGAEIFRQALPLAERIYLTRIHADVPGDIVLPPLDHTTWCLVANEHHEADERHAFACSFQCYERCSQVDR